MLKGIRKFVVAIIKNNKRINYQKSIRAKYVTMDIDIFPIDTEHPLSDKLNNIFIEIRDAVSSDSLTNTDRQKICDGILSSYYGRLHGKENTFITDDGTLYFVVASTEATVSKHVLTAIMNHVDNVLIVFQCTREYWNMSYYDKMMQKFTCLQQQKALSFNIITITNAKTTSPSNWLRTGSMTTIANEFRRKMLSHHFELPVELCDFAMTSLPHIRLDSGHVLVAMSFGDKIGGKYTLSAIPYDNKGNDTQESPIEGIEKHVLVDKNPMGIWELCLLTFATAWMPLYWHGQYERKQYIFSLKDLKTLKKDSTTGHYDPQDVYNKCYKDDRLLPRVQMDSNGADISYCYWTDWGGLICEKKYISFTDGHHARFYNEKELNLRYNGKIHEVLYKYDCLVCY